MGGGGGLSCNGLFSVYGYIWTKSPRGKSPDFRMSDIVNAPILVISFYTSSEFWDEDGRKSP